MRLLLSRYAYDQLWSFLSRPGLEPVILEPAGELRLADGELVAAEGAAPEVMFGSYDLFVEGARGREFMRIAKRAQSLRWFQSPAAGYDGPFFTNLADRGVRITTSHANGVSIAEYVMRAVLDHFQIARRWRAVQERHAWTTHEFREIDGTTWIVIGLGSIGGGVARRAAAFGATVIGCRRYPDPTDPTNRTVTPDQLPSVIGEADVVVVAAPGGPETDRLVDDEFLKTMRPGSVLVNVGRGSIVDEDALLAALDRGVPEAALLDVCATEPLPPDHPFWEHPAVTVTPHNAAYGSGRQQRQAHDFAENLDRFLAGEPLLHDVTDLARTPS